MTIKTKTYLEMKITYSGSKEFELNALDGTFLGKLTYEGWSSTKASITTQFGEFYDIETKGFWTSYISIEKAGIEIAKLQRNWRSQIIIDILGNEEPMDYLFKSVGFWNESYIIEDRHKNVLLTLIPDFNWGKFNYDYEIEVNPAFQNEIDEMKILLAVYCANYVRRKKRQRGATA